MEYQEDAKMSPILRTPYLESSAEDQHWLWVLTFLKQIIRQVIERVGEKSTSPAQGTLTESINILKTDSEVEFEQLPLTPDMSPMIRSEVQSIEMSMSHFPLSKTEFSVVIDKTQDIILELLMNSMEIYLAQDKVSQNKEQFVNSSEKKYGKGSKGNKLRAPCKDRRNEVESTSKQSVRRPFHYNLPKEFLFYKEMMAKFKKTATHAEKGTKTEKAKQPGKERTEK